MMNLRSIFIWIGVIVLSGCASTISTPIKYYDLGGMPPKKTENELTCRLPVIQLSEITAENAFSTNYMLYRLLYSDDQQIHTFANHRWNTTPVQLLSHRIKQQLAQRGVRFIDSGINSLNFLQLRLEIEDFNQYFTDATNSYAQLQVRASLVRDRQLMAQTMFQQQVNADSADAPAGAKAMRSATDELILHLTNWLCEQTQS